MSNKLNLNRVRGFTLIELLVVIAIIGLLSTIIAAPIQNARKKARDAKKIAELKSVQLALEQYAESNSGNYPTNPFAQSGGLSPAYMPLLPTFAASTTSSSRDAFAYVYYNANAAGGATSTFAYHFGAKLEVFGPALETDRDCVAGILSTVLATPNCAVYNGEALEATKVTNGTGIPNTDIAYVGLGIIGTDFNGGIATTTDPDANDEISTSTCVGISECIFDVTSQQ